VVLERLVGGRGDSRIVDRAGDRRKATGKGQYVEKKGLQKKK